MNDSQKNKLRYCWVLPVAVLTLSSVPKIFAMDFMIQTMAATGLAGSLFYLGITELVCVLLFVIPQTRNIGFLLTTACIGGIIAVEWGTPTMNPITGTMLQILL